MQISSEEKNVSTSKAGWNFHGVRVDRYMSRVCLLVIHSNLMSYLTGNIVILFLINKI